MRRRIPLRPAGPAGTPVRKDGDKNAAVGTKIASRAFQPQAGRPRAVGMADVLYLAIVAAAFGALVLLVRACAAIVEDGEPGTAPGAASATRVAAVAEPGAGRSR